MKKFLLLGLVLALAACSPSTSSDPPSLPSFGQISKIEKAAPAVVDVAAETVQAVDSYDAPVGVERPLVRSCSASSQREQKVSGVLAVAFNRHARHSDVA